MIRKICILYFLFLCSYLIYAGLLIDYTTLSETQTTYTGQITISNSNTIYVWDELFFNIWGVEFIMTSQITNVTGAKSYIMKDNNVFIEIPDWQKAIGLNTTVTINFTAQKSGNIIYPQNIKARYMRGPVLYPEYDDLPSTWAKNKQNLTINDLVKDPQDYYSESFNYTPDTMIIYKPPHKTQIYIGQATSVYISGTPNVRIWVPSKYLAMGIAFAYEIFKINPNYMCALATKENWTCGIYPQQFGVFTYPILVDGTTWYWGMTSGSPDGPFQQESGNFTDCKAFYPDYLPDNALHDDYTAVSVSTTDPKFITAAISAAISLTLLREFYNAIPTLWFQDFCLNAKDSFAELVFVTFGYNRGWLALDFNILYPDSDRKNALETTDLISTYNLGGFGDHVVYVKNVTREMNRSDNIYDAEIYWSDMLIFFEKLRMFYGRGVPSNSEWQQMIEDVQKAFNLLAAHWGGNYIRYRYDFLTLLRVMKKYLPTPYNPYPKGVEWKDRLTNAGFRLNVEDLPPNITINSPEDNSLITGQINFDITVTDDNYAKDGGVRKVYCSYIIYGVTNTIILSNGGSGTRYTGSAYLPNGDISLKIVAEDIVGNIAERTIKIKVTNYNNASPTAKLCVLNNSKISGIFKLEAICKDNEYINMVEFYVDNEFLVRFSSNSTNIYYYNLDTTKLNNGPIVVKVVVYDDIYQIATDTATLIIINVSGDELPYGWFEPPTPLENSILISTVTLCVYANDDKGINDVQFYLDNTFVSTYSYAYTNKYYLVFDTSKYKNGNRTLIVALIDTVGQVKYIKRNFILNNLNAPDEDNQTNSIPIILISSPQNGAIINKEEISFIPITLYAYDSDGLKFLKLYINDVNYHEENYPTTTNFVYNWDISNISVGTYTIKAVAQDNLGLQNSISITLAISSFIAQEEIPYIEIISPKDEEYIGKTETLYVLAKASSSILLSKIEFYINDIKVKSISTNDYSGIFEYIWDTKQLPIGTYVLKVEAFTIKGTSNSFTTTVKLVDDKPPLITLIWPQINNYQLTTSSNVIFKVSDEEGIRVFVSLSINDMLVSSGSYYLDNGEVIVSYFLDIKNFSDGSYLLTMEAVNEKGLTSKVIREINIVKTLPQIILNISENSILKGDVKVITKILNIQDDVILVSLFLNEQLVGNKIVADNEDNEYIFDINTNLFFDGQYELKVLALLNDNQTIEKLVDIRIVNTTSAEISATKLPISEKFVFVSNKNIVDFSKTKHSKINPKEVKIYNSLGKLVKSITSYPFEWNGYAENGDRLKSGVYMYILETMDGKKLKGEILLLR